MRQPLGSVDDAVTSDAQVVARVRAGATEEYAALVVRHGAAAVRLATLVSPASDPDGLVGEAFDRVLRVLQSGGGPDIAIRAYLLTVVRRIGTADDPTPFEPGAAYAGHPAGSALASLPERWQLVLWHLDVEAQTPDEVAALLGEPVDSIPGLAGLARAGLQQALDDLGEDPEPDLRAALGPAVLGSAAAAYLAPLPDPVADTPAPEDGPSDHRRPVSAVVLSGLGPDPAQPGTTAHGRQGTSDRLPGGVLADPVASARGLPTSSPTAAATLAGTNRGSRTIATSRSAQPSPSGTASARASRDAASADVGVAARSTSTLPRSYDVANTLRGVPAGRTTSLVVHASPGVMLSSNDMSCTGDGSSTLQCTVGSGTTTGSFSAIDLGTGTGHVTLRVAPVAGFADPSPANNATTLTLS
jgi:hypothetical protein